MPKKSDEKKAKKPKKSVKKAPAKKKSVRRRKSKKIRWLKLLLLLLFLALLFIASYVGYCWLSMPDIYKSVERTRLPSTTILTENGKEIESYGGVYSDVIYADELPDYVVDAVVATEDRRFYSHFGFDIISFLRAMAVNLKNRRYVQGASTITQQVSKNLFLSPKKNIKRKVQELLMAFWLEKHFSKNQILTLYLNRVYMGAGTYGFEAAAQKFFHKSCHDINMHEAAILAGVLKAPAKYNPISNKANALARAKVVLQNMVNSDKISQKQMQQALNMPLGNQYYDFAGGKYFGDWVFNELNAYVGERNVDVDVYTTLDEKIQNAAEEMLQEVIAKNRQNNVTNGAIVVLDNHGAIKAMVGGIDYRKSQYNRATQALRQPGSSFKLFVYLAALEDGFSPQDKIVDSPLQIGKWKPENYDRKYYGEVTLDEAFMRSLNLATVDLSQKVGRKKIIKLAHKMGISSPIADIPSVVLGSSEVKVLEMALAYSVVANGGYANWPYSIAEIYSKDGHLIYERVFDEKQKIISKNSVEKMTAMMQNVINFGTGKRAKLPFFAAGKTGTSQGYRDAWFIGFTKNYTAAVWLGNDDNSSMKNIGGGTLPAEIWKKLMLQVEQD